MRSGSMRPLHDSTMVSRLQVCRSIGPRQPKSCIGKGHDPFATSCETQRFAGGSFHGNTINIHLGNFSDACAHSIAVGSDARSLAHDRYVKMGDPTATHLDALDCEGQETVGTCTAPLGVAWREMHANIAFRQCPEY